MRKIKRELTPPGPITDFFDELHELHFDAGLPSVREIERKALGAVGSTAIHKALKGPAVPGWGPTETIVEALGGRPESAKGPWRAAWRAQEKQGGPADPARLAEALVADAEARAEEIIARADLQLEDAGRKAAEIISAAQREADQILAEAHREHATTAHTTAMVAIGVTFRYSSQYSHDRRMATPWWHRAAAAGDPWGMYYLGKNSTGDASREWFLRAAEAGHALSMLELAELSENTGKADEAAKWKQRADEVS